MWKSNISDREMKKKNRRKFLRAAKKAFEEERWPIIVDTKIFNAEKLYRSEYSNLPLSKEEFELNLREYLDNEREILEKKKRFFQQKFIDTYVYEEEEIEKKDDEKKEKSKSNTIPLTKNIFDILE